MQKGTQKGQKGEQGANRDKQMRVGAHVGSKNQKVQSVSGILMTFGAPMGGHHDVKIIKNRGLERGLQHQDAPRGVWGASGDDL